MSGSSADEVVGILADLVRRRPEIASVTDQVQAAFDLLRTAFADGHKVLTCGDGGSAAERRPHCRRADEVHVPATPLARR